MSDIKLLRKALNELEKFKKETLNQDHFLRAHSIVDKIQSFINELLTQNVLKKEKEKILRPK